MTDMHTMFTNRGFFFLVCVKLSPRDYLPQFVHRDGREGKFSETSKSSNII